MYNEDGCWRIFQLSYPSAGLLTPGPQLNLDQLSPHERVWCDQAMPRRKPNEATQSGWYFKVFLSTGHNTARTLVFPLWHFFACYHHSLLFPVLFSSLSPLRPITWLNHKSCCKGKPHALRLHMTKRESGWRERSLKMERTWEWASGMRAWTKVRRDIVRM